MEHRWGERVRMDLAVTVTANPFSIRNGRLTDLSLSGAHIQAVLDMRLLGRVEIGIVIPAQPRLEAPSIGAYVTRIHDLGFGVEWCEFAPPAVRDLLRIVALTGYNGGTFTGATL
jgi:hypothetical protein